ncbi:MAG: hypothetical protein JSW62_02770 [Thermoplasmatales archaeon]|nr:MAG: hypothetical protein JSW62_02770 [Thermoplasmatales archaeon]
MDEEVKILAQKTVDKIYKKIIKSELNDFHKFGTNTGIGADGTPTKYIDKIAEEVAVSLIKKSDIKVNLLSEEIGFLNFDSDYTFALDPIDGTRNAYRGIPFYSVSLAVGKKAISDVEYGIVKNIPTGDTFTAEKKYGAFLNNKHIAVPEVPCKELLSSLTLGINFNDLTIALATKNKVRSLGSASLEMCMVAIGALDYYVVGKEYIRVVDVAASTLILREAGGVVTNTSGEEFDMPFNLENRSSVVAACNKELIQKLIS